MNFHNVNFIISAVSENQYPAETIPEIAMVGRSNVGKSSLINKILNRKNFARTSSKPGKTTTINFYDIDNKVRLVDLPGYGYAKVSKTEKMKIWEAGKILATAKQKYYTNAVRNGAEAELKGYYIVCPCCNKEMVSNTNYSVFNNGDSDYVRISRKIVYKWSSAQLSFTEEDTNKNLYISSPLGKSGLFVCPDCGIESGTCDDVRKVSISLERKKIEIRSEITDIKELILSEWTERGLICTEFPVYEILTFNLKKGKVHIKFVNVKGEMLVQKDVTSYPAVFEGSISYNLISHNKKVNRTLKRMFKGAWKCELPFCGSMISVNDFFKMTLFTGYSKEFYSTIPYETTSMKVESSFGKIAAKIRCSENVPDVFEESKLPKIKSVRRLFFGTPELMFFLNEAEMMWDVIKDPNLYCDFLKTDSSLRVLSDLHMMPGIVEYISDFCKVKGIRKFIIYLKYGWAEMLSEAVKYGCSGISFRKVMQKKWRENKNIIAMSREERLYSVPMKKPEEKIADCKINDYYFFWLRNSNEYEFAGKKLNNCLSSWSCYNSPVVCIKKRDKYVAAIEVSDGCICQAYGYDNSSIKSNRKLFETVKKWQKQYNLKWEIYDAEDEDDFD